MKTMAAVSALRPGRVRSSDRRAERAGASQFQFDKMGGSVRTLLRQAVMTFKADRPDA